MSLFKRKPKTKRVKTTVHIGVRGTATVTLNDHNEWEARVDLVPIIRETEAVFDPFVEVETSRMTTFFEYGPCYHQEWYEFSYLRTPIGKFYVDKDVCRIWNTLIQTYHTKISGNAATTDVEALAILKARVEEELERREKYWDVVDLIHRKDVDFGQLTGATIDAEAEVPA
jgi:hypothetical protein